MENNNQIKVDINHASIDDLINLPGVGEGLAQRIIAGRPYRQMEDLIQVKGLGDQSLARIRPHIIIEAQTAMPGVAKMKAAGENAAGRISAEMASMVNRFKEAEWLPTGNSPTSNQVLWLALITGGLSIILSVILSLAILAGINRTLNVERHAAVRELNASFSQLNSELGDVSADLASIDQRLQAVEGLSGRMSTVETEFELVQEQVDQAVAEVELLSSQAAEVSQALTRITGKVDLFDVFLEGVRQIIVDLFPHAEVAPSQ